jgi:hypothetical protein
MCRLNVTSQIITAKLVLKETRIWLYVKNYTMETEIIIYNKVMKQVLHLYRPVLLK